MPVNGVLAEGLPSSDLRVRSATFPRRGRLHTLQIREVHTLPSPQKKYTTLVSNTLLFAISNFSSKLLSFFIRPYLSYALDSPDVMGVSSLLQQATNLLIPVVSLGVAYAIIRFGLDKENDKASVFVNGAATIGLGFLVLLLAMPLVSLIPNAAEYLPFLYLCVLASCLRTLCTQFIRSRMLNRLVAIDGVLTTTRQTAISTPSTASTMPSGRSTYHAAPAMAAAEKQWRLGILWPGLSFGKRGANPSAV